MRIAKIYDYMIKIKRAYEAAKKEDGYRVLIDRLWPRGIKKADLVLDEWAKELAPSNELRKSFGHDPSKWKDFQTRYRLELRSVEARQKLEELSDCARKSDVTLVYSAHDEEHNNAVVVKDLLERSKKTAGGRGSRKAA